MIFLKYKEEVIMNDKNIPFDGCKNSAFGSKARLVISQT